MSARPSLEQAQTNQLITQKVKVKPTARVEDRVGIERKFDRVFNEVDAIDFDCGRH
jgi:hypothetical protein